VGPRAGLDDVEKRKFLTLPRLELRPLGRQAWHSVAISAPVSHTLQNHTHTVLQVLQTALAQSNGGMIRHTYQPTQNSYLTDTFTGKTYMGP
jgi:hypothetical protein